MRVRLRIGRTAVVVLAWLLSAVPVAAEDWSEAVRLLDLGLPEGTSGSAALRLTDPEGGVVAEGEALLGFHLKIFDYDRPFRHHGDRLIVDGHLLHLVKRTHQERSQLVVLDDLRDTPMFFILAAVFQDVAETHVIDEIAPSADGETRIAMVEAGEHVFFDRLTVWMDTETRIPKRAEFHDVEDDTIWRLDYDFRTIPARGGGTLVVPHEIRVDTGEPGAVYTIALERFRQGSASQVHPNATHGFE